MSIVLTEAQQSAIQAQKDQPSLILAAAGSGKTLVLCHRILHFIFQGVAANNILAVTFSRRAGQELLHRLHSVAASLVVDDINVLLEGIHVSTFHSFCLRILRAFPNEAGLSSNFIVVTPKMQIQILEDLVRVWYEEKHAEREGKNVKAGSPSIAKLAAEPYGRRSFHTEALKLYQQLRKFESSKISGSSFCNKNIDLDRHNDLFGWVYERYQLAIRSMNGIDFGDFPRLACKVLKNCEPAFTATTLQAQYILVDEFQDTDTDQFQLLRLLCRDHKRLTIIGDDDQQIYTWRGASGFHNLIMFEKLFHGATVTKLEQNFRSTGAIVAAARSVIAKNVNRTSKTIRTLSPTGTTLSVCECRNEECEATAVADFILSLKEQGIPLREIAVLYRLQHVGLELKYILRARGFLCSTRGHISGHGEHSFGLHTLGGVLHDILATLRLVLSESDDLSCKQVMEALCPDFQSSSVLKRAEHLQRHEGIPLFKALMSVRSHLLGLKKHEGLASCGFGRLHQADEHVVEGLHSLRQILETAATDLKTFAMKDVLMNLLQQISPFRTRKRDMSISKEGGNLMGKSIDQQHEGGNLKFAGIKALLKEASKFDLEWENEEQKSGNRELCQGLGKSNGYKRLLQQKTARHSFRESYKLESRHRSHEMVNGHSKRLQSFIDHVSLKLHDGELGDCGDFPIPSKRDAGDIELMDSVVLSTVHQAKGLEWTAVILVRANEGVLPLMDVEAPLERASSQALESGFHVNPEDNGISAEKSVSRIDSQNAHTRSSLIEGPVEGHIMLLQNMSTLNVVDKWRNTAWESIEEERRLMYVALTRAKRFLLVTHVMHQGQQVMLPSRFLSDIPKGLMRRTTCYDSTNKGMNRDALKNDLDVRSSNSYKASHVGSFSYKAHLNSALNGGSSLDAKSKNTTKTKELHPFKGGCPEAGAVDVAQSLNYIDDLLDDSTEPALCTNLNSSTSKKAVKVGIKTEVSKSSKRPRCRRTCQVVDTSSDSSDFETPNKCKYKKHG